MKKLILAAATICLCSPAVFAKDAKDATTEKRSPASNAPGGDELRDDCKQLIQNIVVAASGGEELTDAARKAVTIKHTRLVQSKHTGGGGEGPNDFIYNTHFDGNEMIGSAVVEATRGGCVLSKMAIDGR